MNLGACYYDHFTSFFGDPVGKEVFRIEEASRSIQVLMYDEVFEGCRVFCSLGVTHYAAILGSISEVMLPVDSGWQEVPHILAKTLFAMTQHAIPLGKGVAVRGIQTFNPKFAADYGKTGLYFTAPYGLPSDFSLVQCNGMTGNIHLAIFITDSEYAFFIDNGTEKFETMMETQGVDPYELHRSAFV